METSNPVLNQRAFLKARNIGNAQKQMSISGVVNRTLLLLGIMLFSATYMWGSLLSVENVAIMQPWLISSAIVGFVLAIIISFKVNLAPYLAPIYALVQGIFLGLISFFFEQMYPGIVLQAVGLTASVLFTMLLAYKTGVLRATARFKTGVFAATSGIALFYFASIILSMFGMPITFIYSNGLLGIGFSLFVVVIAALNLVLDFDFIERQTHRGAPKVMEWYASFALMVTLIWLYLEILRLLAKLRKR